MAELREEVRTLRLDVDRLRNENRHLLEVVERLEKDGIKDPGHEFDDPIDEQEMEVEDWCAMLDYPTSDVMERYEMITSLTQFADFLAEDNSDEVGTRVEMCGGLAKIKKLRSHANETIRHRSDDVLSILSSKTRSREGGIKESDVAKAKKEQSAIKPVSRRSGRGRHNPRKTK